MKPWLNVNLEPITCIITRGNSVKVARSQTHLSRIGVCILPYTARVRIRITNRCIQS